MGAGPHGALQEKSAFFCPWSDQSVDSGCGLPEMSTSTTYRSSNVNKHWCNKSNEFTGDAQGELDPLLSALPRKGSKYCRVRNGLRTTFRLTWQCFPNLISPRRSSRCTHPASRHPGELASFSWCAWMVRQMMMISALAPNFHRNIWQMDPSLFPSTARFLPRGYRRVSSLCRVVKTVC